MLNWRGTRFEVVRNLGAQIQTFTLDVTLLTPFMEIPITGIEAVVTSLKETSKDIEDINVLRLVVEDEFACAIIKFKNKDGITVDMCDAYRVLNGKFAEMRPYFDPRPLIGDG